MLAHPSTTFTILDDSLLDAFANPVTSSKLRALEQIDHTYNFCPDCQLAMSMVHNEYQCGDCGYTAPNDTIGEASKDASGGRIRITTGANKGRYRNVNNDYSKTQRKNILEQLTHLQNAYTGAKIPLDVLGSAADQYNSIQKIIKDLNVAGDNGNTDATTAHNSKFVRRGDMKDEIIAALIYFECIAQKIPRKKNDIAAFMGLATQGFARGEDILRNLAACKLIELPSSDDVVRGFTERYFETLGITNQAYITFVIEVVNRAAERKIGMGSQTSSKIVGVMWIVITKCGLGTAVTTLEKAADNTKKNTFMKFHKAVMDNLSHFTDLFKKYAVPVV